MGERRGAYRIFMGKLEEKNRLEVVGVGGTVLLVLILKKKMGWEDVDWTDMASGTSGLPLNTVTNTACSIKCVEVLD
jgi:hypothetical protein